MGHLGGRRGGGYGTAVWQGPETQWGSYPRTQGGANLHWGAGDRLVFLADIDGWPHVYSVPATGGAPLLLTPGSFMVEYVRMTPDRRSVIYNANTGGDKDDIERRHLFRVPVDAAAPAGAHGRQDIEWAPVVSGDGATLALFRVGRAQTAAALRAAACGRRRATLTPELVAQDFPTNQLVDPEHVTFKAPTASWSTASCSRLRRVHSGPGGSGRSARAAPAIVFVHGGPPRQMLLGWHYMLLLRERLRGEPVPREPRLRRAVGQLPAGHRLRPRLPATEARRRARCVRVPGRARRRQVPAARVRRRSGADRDLGRLLRRLPHGDGPRAKLRRLRRGRRHPRRARRAQCRPPTSGAGRGGATASRARDLDELREGRVGVLAGLLGEDLEVARAAHPRRR